MCAARPRDVLSCESFQPYFLGPFNMTVRLFDVTFRVTGAKLPTVLSVLDRDATLQGVVPVAETAVPVAPAKRAQTYANGRRNKGISGEALVLECLDRGITTFRAISEEFVARGFARNSASPALSQLSTSGRIACLGNGVYSRTNGVAR